MAIRTRKVGGIRFIRIGRLQMSVCMVRRTADTNRPTMTEFASFSAFALLLNTLAYISSF